VRVEQQTLNYWFYFTVPEIPKDIWEIYQELKRESRILAKGKESELELESYKERLDREKMERWVKIAELKSKGNSHAEIGAVLGCSAETIRRNLRAMEAWEKVKGKTIQPTNPLHKEGSIIFNHNKNNKFKKINVEFNKEQNVE